MSLFKRLVREEFPFVCAAPALIWELFFLYLPVVVLLWYSIVDYGNPYLPTITLTLSHYADLCNPLYFKVLANSFLLAALTAIICLLIAYPVAYFVAFKVKRLRMLFMFFLILPSWTSLIVQIYAWFSLLEKRGFLNELLLGSGLITKRIHMLNNKFAIMVGMVYCFLPFMTLPLYAVLEKMDKKLLEASADLGANRFETLRRIVFPLSLPGVAAGMLLVFVPAFGEFAIPELLGGAKQALWGSLIVSKFVSSRDMHSGAALACLGVVFVLGAMAFCYAAYRLFSIMSKNLSQGGKRSSSPVDEPESFLNDWGE